jgi:hypothetical protein
MKRKLKNPDLHKLRKFGRWTDPTAAGVCILQHALRGVGAPWEHRGPLGASSLIAESICPVYLCPRFFGINYLALPLRAPDMCIATHMGPPYKYGHLYGAPI